MRIKLVRTGGFIPVKKAVEAEINISAQELDKLLEKIQADPSAPRIRDGQYYELTAGESSVNVDMEKVPEEYKELFNNLKSQLKIVR
jgi:hypothetical protein